jgi:hypothetical protein
LVFVVIDGGLGAEGWIHTEGYTPALDQLHKCEQQADKLSAVVQVF